MTAAPPLGVSGPCRVRPRTSQASVCGANRPASQASRRAHMREASTTTGASATASLQSGTAHAAHRRRLRRFEQIDLYSSSDDGAKGLRACAAKAAQRWRARCPLALCQRQRQAAAGGETGMSLASCAPRAGDFNSASPAALQGSQSACAWGAHIHARKQQVAQLLRCANLFTTVVKSVENLCSSLAGTSTMLLCEL